MVEMKEKKKIIFKKPKVLATLKIPTADEIPYSPSYKRFLKKILKSILSFHVRKTPQCLSLDLVEIDNMVDVAKPEGVFTNTKSKEKVNKTRSIAYLVANIVAICLLTR